MQVECIVDNIISFDDFPDHLVIHSTTFSLSLQFLSPSDKFHWCSKLKEQSQLSSSLSSSLSSQRVYSFSDIQLYSFHL